MKGYRHKVTPQLGFLFQLTQPRLGRRATAATFRRKKLQQCGLTLVTLKHNGVGVGRDTGKNAQDKGELYTHTVFPVISHRQPTGSKRLAHAHARRGDFPVLLGMRSVGLAQYGVHPRHRRQPEGRFRLPQRVVGSGLVGCWLLPGQGVRAPTRFRFALADAQ